MKAEYDEEIFDDAEGKEDSNDEEDEAYTAGEQGFLRGYEEDMKDPYEEEAEADVEDIEY